MSEPQKSNEVTSSGLRPPAPHPLWRRKLFCAVCVFLRPKFFVPLLGLLFFLGAMFWAKAQDPFSRRWFTLKTASGERFKCVAVLPKPIRPCPVILYAHGSGGSLMNDGFELRQMAEMGLAAVSIEYDPTNEVAFPAQFEALLKYLGRQTWADTNAVAWVGFSLGANRLLDYATLHPAQSPQLLVLVSGKGADQSTNNYQPSTFPPLLLIHGEQDEVFPVADVKQQAAVWQSNGVPATLKILPGLSHSLAPERGAVFRGVGEYCRSHLGSSRREEARSKRSAMELSLVTSAATCEDGWQNYHSIAEWKAEAPPLWLFWLPGLVATVGFLGYRRFAAFRQAEKQDEQQRHKDAKESMPNFVSSCLCCLNPFWWKHQPQLSRSEIALRWLAAVLALWALTETALHLVPPRLLVSERTLTIARKMLVPPKERTDFEILAAQPIWSGHKLKTLLDHVELAGYNRQLINWQLDDSLYRDQVLSPIITGKPGERLNWRRPLWEEFYPRIRHESSPADAAKIVVRHLRERVTIAALPNATQDVPGIWLRQITDAAGFEIIDVAALRSVGVPARLDAHLQAEFFDGGQWRAAPPPLW